MDWTFSIYDGIQLIIPWASMTLLLAIVIAYTVLYVKTKNPFYLSGLLISTLALFYVFFEGMVIVSGWTNSITTGRIYHRIGQLVTCLFPYAMMRFVSEFLPPKGRLRRISAIIALVGLAVGILIILLALVIPESFISATRGIERAILSPSDFVRGQEGFLYRIRDAVLAFYALALAAISTYALIKNRRDHRMMIIMAGVILLILGAVDDMLFINRGHNLYLSTVRFSRFSLGIAQMIILFLTAIVRDFFHAQRDLVEAHEKLKVSEKKYRILAEGADQAIFSLSHDLKFLSVNNKAQRLFALNNADSCDRFIERLDSSSHGQSQMLKEVIHENFETMKRQKESSSFRTILKDPVTGEPEEYDFQFDYFEGDKVEYIGRANRLRTNRISSYIEFEKLKLSMENYIIMIDDVASRLTHALGKFMDQGQALQIKMGLQEIIINAIEHGNLGITFEEKSQAIAEGRYLDFLKERQREPHVKDRQVSIDYVLSANSVKYLISDEGEGFNYRKTMKTVAEKVSSEMLAHGRGINMTHAVFDSVKYNKRGNQVLLVKSLV